jgi:anaerobic selenocysteine-containing dehydrogenase
MTTMAWQTWVEVHPATARELGIQDGEVVRVVSPYGSLEAPVYVYPAIRPDTVAIPSGQGHTDLGRYAQGRGDNVLKLVSAEAGTDGGLAWANLRVSIEPTGRQAAMARFENRIGVTEGFINQGFPGE